MLAAVIIINVFISLVCFYIAWKIWRMGRTIALCQARITALDRCSTNVLAKSPNFFARKQQGAHQLRRNYQQLEWQLQQLQQLLGLLGLGRMLWRRRDRPLS